MGSHTLERLLFDPADAAEGPSIGSYINTVTGGVIDSTDVAGTDGLNVNVLNDIDVDLDHANDSVKVGDGTDFLAVNGDGSINSVVTATDLDIRDLAFATDSVDVSGSEVSLDAATLAALETVTVEQGTSPWVIGDGGGAITVDAVDLDIRDLAFATDSVTAHQGGTWSVTATATDLDIRDLAHTQDSVKVGDGTDFLAIETDGSINVNIAGESDDAADAGDPLKIGFRAHAASAALSALSADGDRADGLSDLYRRLFINDAPNIAGKSTAVSVDNTAGGTLLAATELAGRTRFRIQNAGNKSIWYGFGTLTTALGIELPKGGTATFEAGEAIAMKAITASATAVSVKVMEMA